MLNVWIRRRCGIRVLEIKVLENTSHVKCVTCVCMNSGLILSVCLCLLEPLVVLTANPSEYQICRYVSVASCYKQVEIVFVIGV